MKEIGEYKIHPLANSLPMMNDKEFETLKENIRAQGLQHPIITTNKKPVSIIDGRNRLKACLELDYDPTFITIDKYLRESNARRYKYNDDEVGLAGAEQSADFEGMIKELILIENVYRRHLTDFERFLNLKAIEGYPEPGRPEKETQSVPLSELASKLGKSPTTVKMMNWLDGNAPEDVKDAVIKGDLSVKAAYTFVKLCKDYELTEEQQIEAARNIMESKNFGEKQMISVIQDILYPPNPEDDEVEEEEEEPFNLDEFVQPIRGQTLRLRKSLINLEKLLEEIGEEPFQGSVEYMLFSKEIGKLERKIKNFHVKELKA